ncbi:hypothetical protein RHS01_05440 [Rhizoctonia solani]|uniref:Uncharacterized protein n=1 Tax=Rhizoctonia solani TaxID=456999 RepID=A0A8H7IBH9_9AGAM|nr:hypothetical protein RHS01_05440 [Rhizoctonia solani]
MLGNVGVTWELVPYNVWAAVLVSTKAAYPVLYRFPEDWAGKALMKTICKNKRDTRANKQGRLRRGKNANTNTPLQSAKEEPAKEESAKEEPVKEEPIKEELAKEEPVEEELAKEEPDDVGVRVSSTRTADLGKKRCRIEDSNSEDEPEVKQSVSKACTLTPAPTPTSDAPVLKPSACASKFSSCTHKPAASNTPATKAKTPLLPPLPSIGKTTNQTAPITKSTNTGASPSLKRKAQPEPGPGVESNLETATKPAKPPPTKRQKGSVHTKGKVSGRSNSWAQNCQDEVSQLESASAKTKKKSTAVASTSASISTKVTAALNTAVAPVSEPSDSVPKPRVRPKPRPPPQDLSAATSHAAKSEMVNEFDLSKTVPMKTRAAAKKK